MCVRPFGYSCVLCIQLKREKCNSYLVIHTAQITVVSAVQLYDTVDCIVSRVRAALSRMIGFIHYSGGDFPFDRMSGRPGQGSDGTCTHVGSVRCVRVSVCCVRIRETRPVYQGPLRHCLVHYNTHGNETDTEAVYATHARPRERRRVPTCNEPRIANIKALATPNRTTSQSKESPGQTRCATAHGSSLSEMAPQMQTDPMQSALRPPSLAERSCTTPHPTHEPCVSRRHSQHDHAPPCLTQPSGEKEATTTTHRP